MSHYKYHVFFCTNQREPGEMCCGRCNAQEIRDYAKAKIKEMGLAGEGGVRMNSAGCLGRCESGPVIVIYPQAVWYTYVDRQDVDEIISEHLQNNRVVERLLV
jgi:(2Fe-2S) ferredoxin